MPAKSPDLERRKLAIEATRDHFVGKPFEWGRVDCAKVAAYHLRKMGKRPSFAKAGSYNTALGAKRALARSGYASLKDALTQMGLLEIPPAAALPGDIMIHDAQLDGFEAMQIIVGNAAVFSFYEDRLDEGLLVVRLARLGRVFRV